MVKSLFRLSLRIVTGLIQSLINLFGSRLGYTRLPHFMSPSKINKPYEHAYRIYFNLSYLTWCISVTIVKLGMGQKFEPPFPALDLKKISDDLKFS